MAYGDFKDLNRRAAADKVLRDKAFDIAKNSKYDEYQCGLTLVFHKCLLLMLFKKIQMDQNANQIKYGLTKAVNFTIDQ